MTHHNDGRIIGYCVVAAFAGGHFLLSTLKKWQRARLVQDTPVVPIHSAPQGLIEIEGHAWPSQTTHIAPLSQRPCVFYTLLIEHLQQSGKNSHWVEVYSDTTKDPFHILDASGLVLLNPDPGECTVEHTTLDVSKLSGTQKSKIFELMGKTPSWFSGRYRVTEGAIVIGGPAYALGTFRTSTHENKFRVAPGATDFLKRISGGRPPATLLELGKINYIHNGHVDKKEQINYFHNIALEILKQNHFENMAQVSGESSFVTSENISEELKCAGLMMSTEGRPIYFADCYKDDLEQRLRHWFVLKIIGSALMMTLGIFGALFFIKNP